MRVVILGAGGLGSVVGGFLAKSGIDVTLIARPRHAEAIKANGLRIEAAGGDVVVTEHLQVVTNPCEAVGDFDYFVLAVKAKDTTSALADAGTLRDRIACALSLQNSIEKDGELALWCGTSHVLGASITDAGTLIGPGHAAHRLSAEISAYFGELDGRQSSRADSLAAAFRDAGLGALSTDQIVNVEWEKLAQICIAATWATSTFGTTRASIADGWIVPDGVEQYVQIGKEVLQVYRGMGYEPQNFYAPLAHLKELENLSFDEAVAYIDKIGRSMRKRGVKVHPSMHQDLLNGRVTEADQIIAPFLRAADSMDLQAPTLRGAYRVIKTIEAVVCATEGLSE